PARQGATGAGESVPGSAGAGRPAASRPARRQLLSGRILGRQGSRRGLYRRQHQANQAGASRLRLRGGFLMDAREIETVLAAVRAGDKVETPLFQQADLTGRDLSGLTFNGFMFLEADLSRAQLKGVVFEQCIFQRCRFEKADLGGARFDTCMIQGMPVEAFESQTEAVAEGPYDRALSQLLAGLPKEFSTAPTVCDMVLAGADLTGCPFDSCELAFADFTGANLVRATLEAVGLRDVRLGGVEAGDSSWTDCRVEHCDLDGTRLREAIFRRHQFRDTRLRMADLSAARLDSVTFTRCAI